MELNAAGGTLYAPNGTVRMSDGDHLSICYTDANGGTHLVNISARALALSIREQRSGDELFIQPSPHRNVYMDGWK